MEAPSPLGCNALPVVAFVNKLSAALAKEGIQTSYCIGSMRGDTALAQALNKTAMRTVPMGLCAHTAFHSALPSRAAVVYRPRPHHTLLGSESAGWKGNGGSLARFTGGAVGAGGLRLYLTLLHTCIWVRKQIRQFQRRLAGRGGVLAGPRHEGKAGRRLLPDLQRAPRRGACSDRIQIRSGGTYGRPSAQPAQSAHPCLVL